MTTKSRNLLITLRTLLFVVGSILVVECLLLLTQFKLNFGTIVPFLIGLVFLGHAVFWQRIQSFLNKHSVLNKIWKALWFGFFIWLISFIIFSISLHNNLFQSQKDIQPVKAIIVLGGGIKDEKPTPTLANRLDTSVAIIKQHPEAIVIPSGGIGIAQESSEGEIMKAYLVNKHGIDSTRILAEEASTSTDENFLYSQPILKAQGISLDDPIAIVTSDFHIPRSKAIAKHQGYESITAIASPTPLSIRYNAWFREYFAYISGWILGEY